MLDKNYVDFERSLPYTLGELCRSDAHARLELAFDARDRLYHVDADSDPAIVEAVADLEMEIEILEGYIDAKFN